MAITEFGCSTYRGAADHGARGGEIIEYDGLRPVRLKGVYVRDELEQATYVREVLDVFQAEGVDAAFVCTFIQWHLPHRDDPERDLDMASVGIVKVLEDGPATPTPNALGTQSSVRGRSRVLRAGCSFGRFDLSSGRAG